MRLVWHVAGLAGAFASTAGMAGARTDDAEKAQNRKYMYAYASCVVKLKHDRAASAIMSNAGQDTIVKKYRDLVIRDCLGKVAPDVDMRFGGDLYRYALADALVNADFASDGAATFADRLPLAHLTAPTIEERDAAAANMKGREKAKFLEDADKDATVAWLSRYGECIVRGDPRNSRLWLLTKPDVPEEASRIDALRSVFAACLPAGKPLRFSRVTMRGAVAINYYRLANATRHPEVRN